MSKLSFWVICIVLGLCRAALAGEPSSEPILTIEAGMHTGMVTSAATDPGYRFLVTGSLDRTVRLWSLADGHLIRVLRPPICAEQSSYDQGQEGTIYSVAVSPDGATIACAGSTGKAFDNAYYVYLFDRASGRMRARLLPEIWTVALALAFSPDGKYLAMGGNMGGHFVFRTDNGKQVAAAPRGEYKGVSYGVDFSRDGRLVTTCADGTVRLFDRDFKQIAIQRIGGQAGRVRFSPDGSRLAVGFFDSPRVALLAGKDLAVLPAADTSGMTTGSLGAVAWSPDGRWLYGGGNWWNGTSYAIRRWEGGTHVDLNTTSTAGITALVGLPGGVAWTANDPAWGVVDSGGRRVLGRGSPLADMRNIGANFGLSPDASTVSYAYQLGGQQPARFDSVSQTVAKAGPMLTPPNQTALPVTDWLNRYDPKFNGQPLHLSSGEMSQALAIAPDGSGFALGTNMNLYYFIRGSTGDRWRMTSHGGTRAINFSADGKVTVAAFADGTIHWYNQPGLQKQELLTFFPSSDGRRWIAWTLSGYYAASPGGEDMIGWYVNKGSAHEADFYPASRFRAIRWRPDVVSRVVARRSEADALAEANAALSVKRVEIPVAQALPPLVSIVSPDDGVTVSSPQVTVRFTVRSNEPVTAIRALVDGRPVEVTRDLALVAKTDTEKSVTVPVPSRDSVVSIIAENRFAASEAASVRLHWGGAAVAGPKPRLFIVAVGVSKYANPALNLQFAAKDAEDFVAAARNQVGTVFQSVDVKLLVDAAATRDAVDDALDWIVKQTTANDVAMVYISGHGANSPDGDFYFIPHNFDVDHLRSTGVVFREIRDAFCKIRGKVLLFVDTCHSGNVWGGKSSNLTGMVNELSSAENGAVVYAASTGAQVSLEDPKWSNGAFTHALVEGLTGRAESRGRVTVKSLDLYLSERVRELTGERQTPATVMPAMVTDIVIAVKK